MKVNGLEEKKLKRIGECNRCGDCCRDFVFIYDIKEGEEKDMEEERVWLNFRNNVSAFKDVNPQGKPIQIVQTFNKCKHLIENSDGTTTCAIYPDRPDWHCKQYPHHPDELKGMGRCSYKFIEDDKK